MNIITMILLFFQTINILTNKMETGTQGSIDGYLISIYIGIILSIAIIVVQLLKKHNHDRSIRSKIIFLILLAFGLLLYSINFKFLYYVTLRSYTINDIITNSIDYGLAVVPADNGFDKFYPIIVYLLITVNVIICFINIIPKKPSGN